MNDKIVKMRNLVNMLNEYRNAYYNYNQSLVTDEKYDELFDVLVRKEEETGIILSNSPTHTVGFEVQTKLNKVKHDHLMLSLGKTKDFNDIIKFSKNKSLVAMLKMDGLTCSLNYDSNGNLIKAETRGNGEIGEDVLKNAKFISNIPLKINNNGVPLTVDGEVIIKLDDFNKVNNKLNDNEKYSHPRNLASGSIRQLDTKVTKERNLSFIAWRVIRGLDSINNFNDRLNTLRNFGFEVVPHIIMNAFSGNDVISLKELELIKKQLVESAEIFGYPIDGLVFTYNDINYANTLGKTAHHPLHSIAFKFYDETFETTLKSIEWNTSRTGQINPVAVFDPVEIDGTIVNRATLHNITYMKNLQLGIGDTITVFKANQIIPKVDDNLTRSNTYEFPSICPCCHKPVTIHKDGIAEVMYCENTDCPAQILSKFVHFVSKPGMNIDGLSESTLKKFIDKGFLKTYKDIYHLNNFKDEIKVMPGFGEKSYTKLIDSIEQSRNVKLENFLVAMGIPMIGKSASKTISEYFHGDYEYLVGDGKSFDFTNLKDFGQTMHDSMISWLYNVPKIEDGIAEELNFIKEETNSINLRNNSFKDKTFCVTGKFETMKRSEIEDIITKNGGKLTGSVSKKTDYLLTNDANSGSSKAKKAKELNISIMDEKTFKDLIQ